MALAFSCGFTGRVLFKPRIAQASYSNGKSSKIPSLMRYIPKQSRNSNNQKLESVQFPQHRAENLTVFHEKPQLEDDEPEASRRTSNRGNADISLLRLVPASQISSSSKEKAQSAMVKNFEADQNVVSASTISRPVESSVGADEKIEQSPRWNSSISSDERLSPPTTGMMGTCSSHKLGNKKTSDDLRVETKNPVEPAKVHKPFTMEEFAAFVSRQKTSNEPEEEEDEGCEASEDGFDEEESGESFLSPNNNPGEKSAARNYAVFLLSRRQRTAAELSKKMSEKNYSPEAIEITLSVLRKDGLQSDTSYAEVFVQSRWSSRGWGPKRIRYELLKKGVDVSNVDKAIQRVFHSEKDESEDGEKWGMSREAAEHLIKLSARKWSSGGNLPVEVRNRRLGAWLQRRGFGWKVIKGVTDSFQPRDHCSETQLVEDIEEA